MSRYTLSNRILPKVMAVLLVLTLLMPLAPAASAAESGSCGRDLEWSFADGTLTITGSGAMADYREPEDVPWHSFRERILRLELPKGLTHVGKLAFYDCRSITAVTIPDTVKTIGDMAFLNCTGMTILKLPEGLESIGENAFELCAALRDLRLPNSLKVLKEQAFYRCSSLRSVEIPRSVTEMGMGVFSYCEELIQATVLAPLDRLPSWTFYGCTKLTSIDLSEEIKSIGHYSVYDCASLSVIYYGGEPGDAEELEAQISEDSDYFRKYGSVQEEKPDNSESYNGAEEDENGDVIVEDTTVTETEDATITVTDKENLSDPEAEDPPTDISATVVEKEGWEQVQDAIEDALEDGDSVVADVFVATDAEVPDSLLEELAGKDVVMNVTTSDGSSYTLDFSKIDYQKVNGLDLSYRLDRMIKDYEELGGAVAYQLLFNKSGNIHAEVKIQLPMEHARRTVTLYQIEWGTPKQLQSVVADENAVAHFYLASVDSKIVYLLGIDVPTVQQSDLLIPDSLEKEYGITEQIRDVDYVITGRKSSWGIGFLEVNKILIGFMLSTAAIVGLVMYSLNKRKLRRGVMPGWEDDEDDEN